MAVNPDNGGTSQRGAAHSFACHLCPITFGKKACLNRHTKTLHRLKAASSLHCPTCRKSFDRRDTLRRHISTHNRSGYPVCLGCNRSFRRDSLQAHLQARQHRTCLRAYMDYSDVNESGPALGNIDGSDLQAAEYPSSVNAPTEYLASFPLLPADSQIPYEHDDAPPSSDDLTRTLEGVDRSAWFGESAIRILGNASFARNPGSNSHEMMSEGCQDGIDEMPAYPEGSSGITRDHLPGLAEQSDQIEMLSISAEPRVEFHEDPDHFQWMLDPVEPKVMDESWSDWIEAYPVRWGMGG